MPWCHGQCIAVARRDWEFKVGDGFHRIPSSPVTVITKFLLWTMRCVLLLVLMLVVKMS